MPLFSRFAEDEHGRVGLALALALSVHAALIYGLHFSVFSDPRPEPVWSLEVALLEKAGGRPEPAPQPGVSEPPAPQPVAAEPPPQPAEPQPAESPPVVAARAPAAPAPQPATRPAPLPQAAELMASGLQMARRAPQPDRAREKRLDPRAMTTPERYYMQAWVEKVERIGTLNFPEEARRRGLTGRLTLDVAVRANGTVQSIRLLRSSGHEVLDDAAFEIVHLAAPFAVFPPQLRRRYDLLHIERTWLFDQSNRLVGR